MTLQNVTLSKRIGSKLSKNRLKLQIDYQTIAVCKVQELKPFTTTHSGLDLTELTAMCHKGHFWVQRNSSPTQKNWLNSLTVASLVSICTLMTLNWWSTHASTTTSHPPSILCSNASRPITNGVYPDDFSWIHRKPKLYGLAQHTAWKRWRTWISACMWEMISLSQLRLFLTWVCCGCVARQRTLVEKAHQQSS